MVRQKHITNLQNQFPVIQSNLSHTKIGGQENVDTKTERQTQRAESIHSPNLSAAGGAAAAAAVEEEEDEDEDDEELPNPPKPLNGDAV